MNVLFLCTITLGLNGGAFAWSSLASYAPGHVAHRRVAPMAPARRRKMAPTMIFLDEAKVREDAWQWAKETAKTNTPKPAVVALYDEDMKCTYVGKFVDSASAVGHLVKKHGKTVVAALRTEPFPPEVFEDDMGMRMMQGLVEGWLRDSTEDNGGSTPVGNTEDQWDSFDPTVSPFIVGALGYSELDAPEVIDEADMSDEQLLEARKEKMFKAMNEAMDKGEEKKALALMKKLNDLGQAGIETGTEFDDYA